MIYVCDAIMGSGKSSAAIEYMNAHRSEKFIYVTPYLEEAARIKKSCPALHFVEPSNAYEKYKHRKSLHTAELIREGKNIATTHQSFRNYTQEMLGQIAEQGYQLIVDESLEIFSECTFQIADIRILIDAGFVTEDSEGRFVVTDKPYDGTRMRDAIWTLRSKNLIRMKNDKALFCWATPRELIEAFRNVFILTYLFEGQSMYYFLKSNNLEYQHIYIQKTEDGRYLFHDKPMYTPDYVHSVKKFIHILDHDRLNEADLDWRSQKHSNTALSKSWFTQSRRKDRVEELCEDLSYLFNKIWKDATQETFMWGTFKSAEHKLRGKGYTNSFVVLNEKATNKYRNKRYLAYLANVFMDVNERQYYQNLGLNVYEETYALSVLVQWIWRSAIRDGEEIWLYLPSIRMRRLLAEWMDRLENGQTQ